MGESLEIHSSFLYNMQSFKKVLSNVKLDSFIRDWESSPPEEKYTVLGVMLCATFILIPLLQRRRSSWTTHLCLSNIITISLGLISLQYRFKFGCFPVILICGLDVVFFSVLAASTLFSLLINSLKTILWSSLWLSL